MPSFKASLLAGCGLATTVLGHGFVTTFTTDGKSNQGFLRKSILFIGDWHGFAGDYLVEPGDQTASTTRVYHTDNGTSGLLLPKGKYGFVSEYCRLVCP